LKGTRLYDGRFRLEDEIRGGGFATVWLASEKGHDAPLALKIARVTDDPGYDRTVVKEAELIQRLQHVGIVRLFPLPRQDRTPVAYARAIELPGQPFFFAMEYLAGGTLGDFLKEVKRLPLPEAAAIALAIARALDHMHQRGYAHNDLKLENIVFRHPVVAGQPYSPTLIDFGIATRTRLQSAAGSFYIMSPEQLMQAKMLAAPEVAVAVDHTKVDVWGLGILLYRMLGGQLPFDGRNEHTVTSRILKSRPQSLLELAKDVPPELDSLIIDGCLAKNPAYRLSLLELGPLLRNWGENVVASRDASAGRKRRLW
jgi:serine/threonine protein kinase